MALIDKASLLMVPSTYEAGKLYNVLPSGNRAPDSTDQNSGYDQTRADFDFDRGSNASATRIGSDGLIKKYRENLLVQSNNFGTTWVNNGTTETSGQSGYDGSSDAWLLEKSIAGGSIRQAITYNGVGVFSIYAKASSLNHMLLYINYGSGTDSQAYFNLLNGSVGTTIAEIDAKIADAGNGWYRCSIAFNTPSATATILVFPSDADGSTSGTSGSIYIQSAQLESGLVATDYLDSTSVTGKAGVLVDLPRINYDANGENGALLLEPSRANLVAYSEYFGSYSKVTSDATAVPVVTDNYAISPEGVNNAARVVVTKPGTDNDYAVIREAKTVTKTSGDKMAQSVYLKATDATQVGKILDIYAYDGSYLSVTNHTLTSDWKRVEVIHTASTGTSNTEMVIGKARGWAGGTTLANMATDFLVYGHQFENGASYATSYIPTMGTSETRAADFGSDDNITESPIEFGANDDFTLFYEGSFNDLSSTSNMIMGGGRQQLGASYKNYWWVQNATSMRITGDDEVRLATTSMSLSDNTNHKLLVKRSGSVVDFFVDGAKLTTTQNNPNTAFTFRSLGWAYTNSVYKVSGNIKKAMIFNEALTDAECISLTS
jgi:hypothetical protein